MRDSRRLPAGLMRMIREGRLNWTGRRLVVPRTRPKVRGRPTLADIVLRDRE